MTPVLRLAWLLMAALVVSVATVTSPVSGSTVEMHGSRPPAADQSSETERGAYEWDDATWWPDPTAYLVTLSSLKDLGVNTLYVDITEAVTLLRDHSPALGSFESAFASLVEEAAADGFRVDAVGGDSTWATSAKKGPAQLLSVVAQMAAAYPAAALDGVQFDVEPWGLPGWPAHRARYGRDWVDFIRSTVTAWRGLGLDGRLGFTVPYWFDGDTGGVPEVTVDGSTGYPFILALAALSSLPRTALNVMAYRNTTTGPNGSVALFSGNVTAAAAVGSPTELLAGQETGNVSPAETTFYGTGCTTFEAASTQITDAFDGDTSFAGIAVDDVESLEALCPG